MVMDLDAIDLDKCWDWGQELGLRQVWLLAMLVLAMAWAHRLVLELALALEWESLPDLG